jgi:DNA-binding MarR family transcriptional regulator
MELHASNPLAEELAQMLLHFRRFGPHNKESSLGMRPSEYMMLAMLVHSESFRERGAKISDLGNRMQITPAAVTHMIDPLVASNFVERLDDSSDRRIVLIRPTPKGIDVVNSMVSRIIKKCEGLTAFLGEKDSKELLRLLNLTFTFFDEKKG